ncbi:MAG: leucyl aminopeptidase [Patescibacteria group bacterium]|nr:leucyl aminopeptidase [Patescibacteria group bacterium]
MVFELTSNSLDKVSCDGVLVFAFEGKDSFMPTKSFSKLDSSLNNLLTEDAKMDNFKGKVGEVFPIHTHRKILGAKIFVLGLGKKEDFDQNILRRAIALFAKGQKRKLKCISLSILDLRDSKIDAFVQGQVIAEGFFLGSYSFAKYKKEENGKELENIIVSEENKNLSLKIKEGIKLGEIYSRGTIIARDLVNEQASITTPAYLANLALDLARKNKNIKCKVLDKEELEKMGMEAFLGVARAADTPPKLICLEYSPKVGFAGKKVAIVGKGITFDTGGINVKTGDSMQTMKCDMSGAAAVLGLFSVITEAKPSVCVLGLIAATPNMISAKGIVPGDVLRAFNGKTIEVLDTDAEGRVTMADSLSYAVKKGANEIIDLATLTGACEVALGTEIAGLFANSQRLGEAFKKEALKAGEKVWELPLDKDYKELNKSEVADIANIPSIRWGGAITAALFLEEFIESKPWIHLDIAGPAFSEKPWSLGPKGGTGFGVRSLLNFLREN